MAEAIIGRERSGAAENNAATAGPKIRQSASFLSGRSVIACFWVRSRLPTEQLLLQAVPCSRRRSNEDHKLHRTKRAIWPRCMTRKFRRCGEQSWDAHERGLIRVSTRTSWPSAIRLTTSARVPRPKSDVKRDSYADLPLCKARTPTLVTGTRGHRKQAYYRALGIARVAHLTHRSASRWHRRAADATLTSDSRRDMCRRITGDRAQAHLPPPSPG